MKFFVFRTTRSSYEDVPPCKEAKKGTHLIVDERYFDSPERHDKACLEAPKWFDEGINHRVTRKGIARDFSEEGWFIEISNLEELLAFIVNYGEVILNFTPECSKDNPYLEIYDGYRE